MSANADRLGSTPTPDRGDGQILGPHPELEQSAVAASLDIDIEPAKATEDERFEIHGVLGAESPFAASNDGVYADAVEINALALLPTGWRNRLIRVQRPGLIAPNGTQGVALCLHPNDVIVSKMFATAPVASSVTPRAS